MNREEMTIDEAIAIIRKEYLCVDRDCDIERSCGKCDLMMPSKEPILEAYKMAIKALKQMPVTTTTGEGGVIYYPQVEGVTPTVVDVGKQEPCDTCGYEEGSIYCKKHCPYEAKVEKESRKDAINRKDIIDIYESCADMLSDDELRGADIVMNWVRNAPPINPTKTGHCKDCKWWKDSDGTYCRGVHAESKCPINRKEVYEGNGYCYMFEPQERSDKDADKKCTYKETGCGSCKRQLDCPIEADKAESEE